MNNTTPLFVFCKLKNDGQKITNVWLMKTSLYQEKKLPEPHLDFYRAQTKKLKNSLDDNFCCEILRE